ncbi:MAG: hypothetical protein ACLPXB_08050, partial [Thiobacillaceae bacterium]
MIKDILNGWFRSTSLPTQKAATIFDQANQSIGNQINIGSFDGDLNCGRVKIPPHIDRFAYRMDRHPQCAALQDRIAVAARRDRPICAVTFGIEDDLPSIFGNSVFEYLQYKAATYDLRAFLPPKRPICHPWPEDCASSEDVWRVIGTKFLDLAALDTAAAAQSALESRAGSIAFGFEMDVTGWEKHINTLTTWIGTLENCRAPQKGVALAVIVVSGLKSSTARLQELHADLTNRYEKHDRVLVLPMLGPVTPNEFKTWHREFMTLASDSVTE